MSNDPKDLSKNEQSAQQLQQLVEELGETPEERRMRLEEIILEMEMEQENRFSNPLRALMRRKSFWYLVFGLIWLGFMFLLIRSI